MQVLFLGQEDPLEESMATLSSLLAWRNPWTEEPGGLQSIGSVTQLQTQTLTSSLPDSLMSFWAPWLNYKGKVIWAQWQRIHLPMQETLFYSWVRKIPWRRKWHPTPVFLPGESHGWRSLAGHSPWGCKESNMTEHTCK